ncbi:hypothetical protein V8F06_007096 [Rhypophila decipiens]
MTISYFCTYISPPSSSYSCTYYPYLRGVVSRSSHFYNLFLVPFSLLIHIQSLIFKFCTSLQIPLFVLRLFVYRLILFPKSSTVPLTLIL